MRPLRPAAAVAAASAVIAGCGSEAAPAPAPPRADPSPAPAPAAPPAASASAPRGPSVGLVWSVEEAGSATARLERHPAVVSATAAGRDVALLTASADRDGRTVERVRSGYAIPLDVLSIDPGPYARTLPPGARRPFVALGPGEAVLSRTSARLRGVGRGGELRLLDGRRLRVTAVVADAAVRDAEVTVAAAPGADRSTVLAVLRPGARVAPEALGRAAEPGTGARILPGGPLRARGPEGPARPAELKARFGEPAVRLPFGDDWIELDRAFVDRHLVARRVPILGSVTCHRAMIAPLRAALGELERRGLARLVDPGDYAGCHAPRRIRPGGALSLHAWGLAVDLNASENPLGGRSAQDPRLVRVMRRHGFTWGGDWPTTPDPMHFEWRGD